MATVQDRKAETDDCIGALQAAYFIGVHYASGENGAERLRDICLSLAALDRLPNSSGLRKNVAEAIYRTWSAGKPLNPP